MRVRECQRAMDRAASVVGIARITHHDLRHLFATRCIESGVDIPTVSRWLGHRDGGALAMKVYGHLRDQHWAAMALKVSFGALEKTMTLEWLRRPIRCYSTLSRSRPCNNFGATAKKWRQCSITAFAGLDVLIH